MKRRKTIRAGRLVWDITYTVPRPNASHHDRKRIREVTEEQIQRTNANTAQRKLEMLMATNFDDTDLVLTVTYRDADLPDSADVTRKHLAKCSRRCGRTAKCEVFRISSTSTFWRDDTATIDRTLTSLSTRSAMTWN